MAAPSPKQRATTLKRQGFDDGVIGAILGLSAEDVRALMYETDPSVALPGGGGVPALHAIPLTGVNLNSEMPDINTDVETWDDLLQVAAPSDATAYLFKVIVSLFAKYEEEAALPSALVLATDSDGFDAWWNDSTPIPGVECAMRGDGDGSRYAILRATLQLPVGPGQVLGLAQAEVIPTSTVSWFDACWIPLS